MKTLTVALPGREYDILIEHGLLTRAGELCRAALPKAGKLAVVTDSNVAPLYGQQVLDSLSTSGFESHLFTVPAGETSKCIQQLSGLWEGFMAFGLTRTDAVVALGGGVVGDLAGFAASTVLRGVEFIQIPTTLLAQVDSSVGGKVAIDLIAGKNLAGAFWQPKLVLMDPSVLNTLDERTFADGMSEVIKYGCIQDAAFFSLLEQNPSRVQIMKHIEDILYTCCNLKRQVVEADERDIGTRMILNFGHTLGHAYELAYHYKTYTHGEAVAAGMVAAAALGHTLVDAPSGLNHRIASLLSRFDLPISISCSLQDYAAAIGLDKKGVGGEITLVLLEQLGKAVLYKIPKTELLERIKELGL